MKLKQFERAGTGGIVYINPDKVTLVEAYTVDPSVTIIRFDKDQFVSVNGTADRVVQWLQMD